MSTVFSGLSPLVIDEIVDQGTWVEVRARTPGGPTPCPECGVVTARVHSYEQRTVADVPLDARRLVIAVSVRRLKCGRAECARQTFREQLPGVLERYQRRTPRLAGQIGAVARELAGRASARALAVLAIGASRHTAVRILLRLPLLAARVPRVLGVDDFALAKHRRYATVLIDAETRERVEVLPDRNADTLEAWLREHPGVQVVCRGDPPGAAAGGAVRGPLAHLAQHDRGRAQGDLRALGVLGIGRACDPRGQTRRDEPGAMAPDPRPAQ